jgi:hypothetical protein
VLLPLAQISQYSTQQHQQHQQLIFGSFGVVFLKEIEETEKQV